MGYEGVINYGPYRMIGSLDITPLQCDSGRAQNDNRMEQVRDHSRERVFQIEGVVVDMSSVCEDNLFAIHVGVVGSVEINDSWDDVQCDRSCVLLIAIAKHSNTTKGITLIYIRQSYSFFLVNIWSL